MLSVSTFVNADGKWRLFVFCLRCGADRLYFHASGTVHLRVRDVCGCPAEK